MSYEVKMPDWDWGNTANDKLNQLFTNQEQKDFFCEYLINEMPVDNLVWYMLQYTSKEVLKELADAIGTYQLEEA